MKKGKIIQDIKTNTSMPVLISTLFYVFLASLFIEGGLWLGSELVGPFSLVIGFLAEFFSPGKLRLCKKKLAQVSSLGDLTFTTSNGCHCPCLPGRGNRVF